MLPDNIKQILYKYNSEVAEEISNINLATERIIDELKSVNNVLMHELMTYAKNGINNKDKEIILLDNSQAIRKYIASIELMNFSANENDEVEENQPVNDNQLNIYSVVVLSNTLKCSYLHLDTEDIIAELPVIDESGKLMYYPVPASYCKECKRYTILKDDFLKINGSIVCKVVDETTSYEYDNSDEIDIKQKESLLFQFGYNVQSKRNLSSKQRQIILASVIESNLMTRRQIVDHLNTLIERGRKIPKWENATNKWRQDKNYVQTYKVDELPSIIFDNIVLKYNKNSC